MTWEMMIWTARMMQTIATSNQLVRSAAGQNTTAQRDPTRTVTLRRQYVAEARRRFEALKAEIRQTIANGLLGDDGYLDTGMISSFITWLRQATPRLILSGEWQERYVRSAYLRGIGQADRAVKQANIPIRPVEVLGIFLYQAEVEALFQQAVSNLARIGQAMVSEIEARLTASLPEHLANSEMETLILDRVDKIGLTRATVMAVTGVVGAVAAATLSRLAGYGVNQVGLLVELTTARTPCPICVGLRDRENGFGPGIFTIEQARGILPIHPRCRCRWSPLVSNLLLSRLSSIRGMGKL